MAVGVRPTAEDSAATRRGLDELGDTALAARLRVSRISVHKIAAGSPVRYGTLVAVRLGLGLITELPGDALGEIVE